MHNSQEKRSGQKLAARAMRLNLTQVEGAVWAILQNRHLSGLKFYHQRVIGNQIVDFYCASACLVVDVDGDIHKKQESYDEIRTPYLEDLGYKVIQLRNEMVLSELDSVVQGITKVS